MNTNKNTIIIALIVLALIVGTGYKAVFGQEDPIPSIEELIQERRASLLAEQAEIDRDNLKFLSACNKEYETEKKASKYLELVNKCYDKLKRTDIDIEWEMAKFAPTSISWTVTPASSGVAERKQVNLRSTFSLWDCRFTNDNHKLPRYNLEWLAYDIACEKWKAFDVSVPDYGANWIVEKIGYWNNLWNFIIIKSNTLRVVYGHTKPIDWLKEWDIVKKTFTIGKTNLSWASTGMHLHLEIWEGTDIVSRERFWSPTWDKQDQKKLLEHRGWDFGQKKKILRDGKELEALTYAWEKYWDMDFIKTIEAESRWDQYAVWDAGDAYWYCQINKNYNPEMQTEYRSIKTPQARIDYCYAQYKTWVDKGIIHKRLYWYNVRNLPQNNKFTFK